MDIKRAKVFCGDEEIKAAGEVLKSGRYVKGPNVKSFEEEFAKFCNCKQGIAVNSGTSALIVALLSVGIKPGDEVITTAHTFVATGNSIILAGAKPVLVDIDPETFNMDAAQIREKITPKTKAVMPVHLYGQAVDMDPINEIAQENNLIVIEDAAQAHGALYKDKKCGSLSDIGCFSFYPTKNMTVGGDGGMLVTDKEEVAEKARMYRDAGRKEGDVQRSYVAGYNFRMSEVQAAVGREQLKRVESWNEERRKIAELYNSKLGDLVGKPVEKDYAYHIYHLYVIRAEERDKLKEFLKEQGIGTGVHYLVPLHLQETFKQYNYKEGDFPNAEKACAEILTMPMYPGLKEEEIDYIVEKVKEFYKG